jgi:hypothetical protein
VPFCLSISSDYKKDGAEKAATKKLTVLVALLYFLVLGNGLVNVSHNICLQTKFKAITRIRGLKEWNTHLSLILITIHTLHPNFALSAKLATWSTEHLQERMHDGPSSHA